LVTIGKKMPSSGGKKKGKAKVPEPEPEPEIDEESEEIEDSQEEDSDEQSYDEVEGSEDEEGASSDSSAGFEDQGSNSDEEQEEQAGDAEDRVMDGGEGDAEDGEGGEEDEDEEEVEVIEEVEDDEEEEAPRPKYVVGGKGIHSREALIAQMKKDGSMDEAKVLDADDLSSDDEAENRNTVGKVPLRWYDEYQHIGYDLGGKKIIKTPRLDGVDAALAAADDPNYWRTVYDAYNDREVVLTDRDLQLIERMQAGTVAHPEHDMYPDTVPYYSSIKELHPMDQGPEPKRRFIPSKWERMKVLKIIKGIQEGRILTAKQRRKQEREQKPKQNFLMWGEDDVAQAERKGPMHVAAPKIKLPGHAESYNPPSEYLLNEEELQAWYVPRQATPRCRHRAPAIAAAAAAAAAAAVVQPAPARGEPAECR
jgi:ribosome biogenesis protein ERB1